MAFVNLASRFSLAIIVFVSLFGLQCVVYMLIKDKANITAQTRDITLRHFLSPKTKTSLDQENYKLEMSNINNVINFLSANSKKTKLKTNSAKDNTTKRKVLEFQKNTHKEIKYILLWTSPRTVPFVYLGTGRNMFQKRKCAYTNCYVTGDRNYFDDYTKFDVIAFAAPDVNGMTPSDLPQKRSPRQKYVFASIESADNYPVCTDQFDGYFNWTWTYKLDSDSRWGYIVIRGKKGNIIGPNKNMHWINKKDMRPVLFNTQRVLVKKKKFAALFSSNCDTRSDREGFVKKLNEELKRYGLTIDIFGKCGDKDCKLAKQKSCNEMIKKEYLFYLAFENALSEDYVTEKILHALNHYAIPIVYGAANYTRFMPDGIYLNAKELGVRGLASEMFALTKNFDKYSGYFKWRSHYKYSKRDESPDSDDFCGICSLLNDKEKMKKQTVYENFREWWDPPDRCNSKESKRDAILEVFKDDKHDIL